MAALSRQEKKKTHCKGKSLRSYRQNQPCTHSILDNDHMFVCAPRFSKRNTIPYKHAHTAAGYMMPFMFVLPNTPYQTNHIPFFFAVVVGVNNFYSFFSVFFFRADLAGKIN